jgi:hypothetical protein
LLAVGGGFGVDETGFAAVWAGDCGFAGAAWAVFVALFCGGGPTVKYFRIFSSFLGPIPRMASRSFTLLKLP